MLSYNNRTGHGTDETNWYNETVKETRNGKHSPMDAWFFH